MKMMGKKPSKITRSCSGLSCWMRASTGPAGLLRVRTFGILHYGPSIGSHKLFGAIVRVFGETGPTNISCELIKIYKTFYDMVYTRDKKWKKLRTLTHRLRR